MLTAIMKTYAIYICLKLCRDCESINLFVACYRWLGEVCLQELHTRSYHLYASRQASDDHARTIAVPAEKIVLSFYLQILGALWRFWKCLGSWTTPFASRWECTLPSVAAQSASWVREHSDAHNKGFWLDKCQRPM